MDLERHPIAYMIWGIAKALLLVQLIWLGIALLFLVVFFFAPALIGGP